MVRAPQAHYYHAKGCHVQTLRAPVTSVSDLTKEVVQVLKLLLNVKFPMNKMKTINPFLLLIEKITQNGKQKEVHRFLTTL